MDKILVVADNVEVAKNFAELSGFNYVNLDEIDDGTTLCNYFLFVAPNTTPTDNTTLKDKLLELLQSSFVYEFIYWTEYIGDNNKVDGKLKFSRSALQYGDYIRTFMVRADVFTIFKRRGFNTGYELLIDLSEKTDLNIYAIATPLTRFIGVEFVNVIEPNIEISDAQTAMVVLSKIPKLFQDLWDSIAASDYVPNKLYLYICADNAGELRSKYDEILTEQVVGVETIVDEYDEEFNYSKVHNLFLKKYIKDIEYLDGIFLCNDDIVLDKDTLNKILNTEDYCDEVYPFARESNIIGCMLLHEDISIQHVGVVLGQDIPPRHFYMGRPDINILRFRFVDKLEATTFALVYIPMTVIEAGVRFDNNLPYNYNDIDFCIEAKRKGFNILVNQFARAIHKESVTRKQYGGMNIPENRDYFYHKHKNMLANRLKKHQIKMLERQGLL